ncbi:unnamed protein product [Rhizoctonia solani]|uniref:Uncharacterized protein n=1 Tax=Rhizoctonia solani TaxID=456999 RepID=A0A8H3HQG4_9AGAM|nr:unnamed protein product [Rhizoctonia solani]
MGRTHWLNPKTTAIGDMVHCIVQGDALSTLSFTFTQTKKPGILVPLLISFLTSSRHKKDKLLFRLYVIFVNGLAFTQTVVHLYDTLDFFDSRAPASRPAILVLTPVLNVTLGASVQLFFIFRCWRIYKEHVLYILPLLALWIAAFIPGLLLGYYFLESVKHSTLKPASIALAIWIFSSFTLELCITTSTVIYLLRTRTGLAEHSNVFKTIWQVTWVSAAPPPILMTIVVINGYIINTLRHPVTAMTVDMTGKSYALSLMITLVGRGYIRDQLDNSIPKSGLVLTVIGDAPVISVTREESSVYELETRGAVTNGVGSECETAYPQDSLSVGSLRSKPIASGSESTCTHQIQLPK